MATVAASNFASTRSLVNYGVISGAESKTKHGRMLKYATAHEGLRPLNQVDELRVKIMGKVAARQATSYKTFKSRNARSSGIIVCGSGMNLVFVGTEVGPWSKTGGLGDVLGGLPPAMAVSFVFISFVSFFLSQINALNDMINWLVFSLQSILHLARPMGIV
jgi:granule-bound starch synthase